MVKWIVLAVVVGAGYWYWNGPYHAGRPDSDEMRLRENAEKMRKCMRREASMAGAAGIAGVGGIADDGEQLCADKYNLYKHEGQWHNYE
jgi:hypothetical protein